jgi:hypothetical protein
MTFEEEIKDKQLKQKKERLDSDKANRFFVALKNLLRTDDGKRVLKHIFLTCGISEPSYSDNTHYMAFREGQRSVAIALKQLMSEEDFLIIMKEEL